MDNKKSLLTILENSGDFVSGSDLAGRLGVTRASVWKYIKSLKSDGYNIEAVTNRGYRLSPLSDVVTSDGVTKELGALAGYFSVEVLPECTSTNSVIKERASELREWHTVIAGRQTEGRGRRGRSFYSPDGTGLYMSVLLRPKLSASDAVLITAAAAVAVCRAVREVADVKAEIKWVNDIYIGGKKVCGILTEASVDMESGDIEYAVLGVGINITEPEGGFPDELSSTAGAVFSSGQHNMRNRLAAAFLKNLYIIYEDFASCGFVNEYRELSFLRGKQVNVLRGEEAVPAFVMGIDDRCRLMVRYTDGQVEALSSGEVSVRGTEDVK